LFSGNGPGRVRGRPYTFAYVVLICASQRGFREKEKKCRPNRRSRRGLSRADFRRAGMRLLSTPGAFSLVPDDSHDPTSWLVPRLTRKPSGRPGRPLRTSETDVIRLPSFSPRPLNGPPRMEDHLKLSQPAVVPARGQDGPSSDQDGEGPGAATMRLPPLQGDDRGTGSHLAGRPARTIRAGNLGRPRHGRSRPAAFLGRFPGTPPAGLLSSLKRQSVNSLRSSGRAGPRTTVDVEPLFDDPSAP
jgi:hypothetical protein